MGGQHMDKVYTFCLKLPFYYLFDSQCILKQWKIYKIAKTYLSSNPDLGVREVCTTRQGSLHFIEKWKCENTRIEDWTLPESELAFSAFLTSVWEGLHLRTIMNFTKMALVAFLLLVMMLPVRESQRSSKAIQQRRCYSCRWKHSWTRLQLIIYLGTDRVALLGIAVMNLWPTIIQVRWPIKT